MYVIQRTDLADNQLRRIILYIVENFGKQAAIEALNEIEEKINLLQNNSYLGAIPHYSVLEK